jgi:hypothetical protein
VVHIEEGILGYIEKSDVFQGSLRLGMDVKEGLFGEFRFGTPPKGRPGKEISIRGSKMMDLQASSATMRRLSFSRASESLETSSRRNISRLE